MKHSVLAPTLSDAVRLTSAIEAAGHHARIISTHGFVGVIMYAPQHVVNNACHRVSFEPGRTLEA